MEERRFIDLFIYPHGAINCLAPPTTGAATRIENQMETATSFSTQNEFLFSLPLWPWSTKIWTIITLFNRYVFPQFAEFI